MRILPTDGSTPFRLMATEMLGAVAGPQAEEQLPDLVVEHEAQGLRVEERRPDLGGWGSGS